jgi:UDP-2-acetamido-3-amino-2,3-dideoxy-glucuronate N-acetyltransferase
MSTLAPATIHPTADVASSARIGEGTRVWDMVRIREDVVIGRECILGRGAYIDQGVHIGDRVKIQNAALVYHGVRVGSGVFIGPAAVLTNDRLPRAVMPDGRLAGADDWTISEIELADGCSIGAGAIVVAGCRVGAWALVGAGAVVTRSVPDHALVVGNPARQLGWVCRCGRRLCDAAGLPVGTGHTGESWCPHDGTRYRVVGDGRLVEEPE